MVDREETGQHRYALPAVVALCVVLFFTGLGIRPLWNQDEGMHAGTSMDMLRSGDWITPTMNGEVFFDKPAFHNWLVAVAILVLGPTELAARLPNAVMGLATVVLTFLIGRRMFGTRAAFLSSVALATSWQFFILSRTVMHDMTLTFCVTATLGLFYVGASNDYRQRGWFVASAAALGLAVLAKGPAGAVLPGGVVVFYLAFRRELSRIWRMPLVRGILVFLLVTVPWYVAVARANPSFLKYFFVELNFGSFASAKSEHPAPFWYYVPVLLGTFAPWSFFLPVALWRSFRRRAADPHGESLFLLLWIGIYLVFFSMAVSKLATYILPIFPAAALLVGRLWDELISGRDRKLGRALGWSVLPVAVVFFGLIGLLVVDPQPDYLEMYAISLVLVTIPLVVSSTVLLVGGALAFRGRPRWAFGAVVASSLAMLGLSLGIVVPKMSPFQTSKDVVIRMDALVPAGEPLTMVGKLRDTAFFYTDRLIRQINQRKGRPDLLEHLGKAEAAYCLIDAERWADWGSPGHKVATSGKDVLIANEPGLSAAQRSSVLKNDSGPAGSKEGQRE
jgi:4-amino-4-deoxy-L-arabinose transferase-like glycosyltransferase